MNYVMKGLTIFGLGLLIACAGSRLESIAVQPPDSWLVQFEGNNARCLGFDNTYVNQGEPSPKSKNAKNAVYLSDLMFSRLRGGRLPGSVELATNSQSGQLSVVLIGNTTRDLQYGLGCDSGWHVLKKSRSGEYLGDGVVEKQFERVAFFRTGNSGELIVRVITSASFNSMYLFNSEVEAEGWYRFQPVSP